MKRATLDQIVIKQKVDESPDLSWLGEYSDRWQPGAIDRKHRVSGWSNRQLRYFIPGNSYKDHWDGLHNMGYSRGNCDYLARQYVMQDFQRMERYANGDLYETGIIAEAIVTYPESCVPPARRIERLTSAGIWGIASDTDEKELEQEIQGQLADLKDHLRVFNVGIRNFNKVALAAERQN